MSYPASKTQLQNILANNAGGSGPETSSSYLEGMGSIPFAGTNFSNIFNLWPTGVMAARLYHTEKVLGSIPRSATNIKGLHMQAFSYLPALSFSRAFLSVFKLMPTLIVSVPLNVATARPTASPFRLQKTPPEFPGISVVEVRNVSAV